jgi:hypothetical protein
MPREGFAAGEFRLPDLGLPARSAHTAQLAYAPCFFLIRSNVSLSTIAALDTTPVDGGHRIYIHGHDGRSRLPAPKAMKPILRAGFYRRRQLLPTTRHGSDTEHRPPTETRNSQCDRVIRSPRAAAYSHSPPTSHRPRSQFRGRSGCESDNALITCPLGLGYQN